MSAYLSLPCCWLLFNWITVLFGEQDKWWLLKSSLLFILVTQCIATRVILYAPSKSCTEFGIVYSLGNDDGECVCACLFPLYLLHIVVTGKIFTFVVWELRLSLIQNQNFAYVSDFQYPSFTSKACVVVFDNFWHFWSSLEVQAMKCVNRFSVLVPRKGLGSL